MPPPGNDQPTHSGVGPELRFIRSDEMYIYTYMGIFGRPGSQTFSRRWRAVLNDLVEPIGAVLDRGRTTCTSVDGTIAVSPQGDILAADVETEQWFRPPERLRALRALVRYSEAQGKVSGPVDGARVHLRAANGTFGRVWIGQLIAPTPLEWSSDAQLTPAQREVAGYAAVGATSAEIARTLGIRVETVRTHIRDIYQRLGISTRAELARRWAHVAEEHPSAAA